jgi:hypothetical protein
MNAWGGRASAFVATLGFAVVLVCLLLSHPQTSVFQSIVELASWLRGAAAKPDVVTWPAWGYAWVVAWIRNLDLLVAMQACLGSLALILLVRSLSLSMPRQRTLIAVLCVLAIPWHDMQATLYPSGLAGSLVVIALLSLGTALTKADVKKAVLAGTLFGLAQNIRTEFVLMPVFIGVGACVLRHFRIVAFPSLRPLGICILTAVIFQLPWGFFYHAETGRFSLTESNFGHVLYVSLGSDPGNPWGVVGNDQGAMQAVRDAGYSFSSLSEPGNQFLQHLVWVKVKQHPYGLVPRTIQQLRNTFVAPFNWGEPKMDETGKLDLDVLRQELKAHIGVAVNVAKLNDYRARDLYSKARQDGAAVLALMYQFVGVGLGALVFLMGILGMVWAALMRPGETRAPPLAWLLACAAIYKVLQDALLFYQVNYLNNVYPMFLPFVALSATAIKDRLQRHPASPIAAATR